MPGRKMFRGRWWVGDKMRAGFKKIKMVSPAGFRITSGRVFFIAILAWAPGAPASQADCPTTLRNVRQEISQLKRSRVFHMLAEGVAGGGLTALAAAEFWLLFISPGPWPLRATASIPVLGLGRGSWMFFRGAMFDFTGVKRGRRLYELAQRIALLPEAERETVREELARLVEIFERRKRSPRDHAVRTVGAAVVLAALRAAMVNLFD